MMRPSFCRQYKSALITLSLFLLLNAAAAHAQSTSFTYQGRLSDGGTPANGNYDLQFALWDSNSGGTQIGATQTVPTVPVSVGIFTVQLDFGANAFPGANRFLEISTRLSGTASFTTLSPRQQITSTPYAIRSLSASSADAVTVNGVPSGSDNYIQNATTQQATANFNISGDGTAGGTLTGNVVNANTQYNIGGNRVLSTAGTRNVFVGAFAGQANTTGAGNSFFGSNAGRKNVSGGENSFFGSGAGGSTTNNANSFFGSAAGANTTDGAGNSFFGEVAGLTNNTGSGNTLIGFGTDVGSDTLINATALGATARVDQSNSLVLGSIAGFNHATTSVNVGIGTTTPQASLDIAATGDGAGLLRFSTERPWVFRQAYSGPGTALRLQPISGLKNFEITAAGGTNVATFVGDDANPLVGIGTTTPTQKLTIRTATSNYGFIHTDGTITVGSFVGGSGNGGWYGTKSNHNLYFFTNDSSPQVTLTTAGNVGIGATSPLAKLDIAGTLKVDSLAGGGDQNLCRNSVFNTIATCSSSLRYKKDLVRFAGGLDIIDRLRPIAFTWKQGGMRDVGLAAEEVEKVEPLLTFRNERGEVEGVRYNQLSAVFINAIKEQQDQIERQQAEARQQQEQIARQQLQIEQLQQQQIAILKKLVCLNHPRARICKQGD